MSSILTRERVMLWPTGVIAVFLNQDLAKVEILLDDIGLRQRLQAAPEMITNPAFVAAKQQKLDCEAAYRAACAMPRVTADEQACVVAAVERANARITAADTVLRETPPQVDNPAHAAVAAYIFAAAEAQRPVEDAT